MGVILLLSLVEAQQSQVAPDGGEVGIEIGSLLPVSLSQVVLPFVIVQASQVIRCPGIILEGVHGHHFQDEGILQAIGEAIVGAGRHRLLDIAVGFSHSADIGQIIVSHGRLLPTAFEGCIEQEGSLVAESGMNTVESRLMVVIDIAVHQRHHAVKGFWTVGQQVFLHHAEIVEGVCLVRCLNPCQRLCLTSHSAQDGGFQGTRLVVVAVADECSFQLLKRLFPAFLIGTDAGGLIIAGIGPGLVPGRLPEAVVGRCLERHVTVGNTQVEQGLAIVGVGIALLHDADGGLQISLGFPEAGTSQIPQAHLHIAAVVQRVTPQGLLVIVECTPGGMAVLLQVQARQVQLVNGLRILWRERCLGSIGDGTYFVGLRFPLQQRAPRGIASLADGQVQLADSRPVRIHSPDVHLLRAQRHLFTKTGVTQSVE